LMWGLWVHCERTPGPHRRVPGDTVHRNFALRVGARGTQLILLDLAIILFMIVLSPSGVTPDITVALPVGELPSTPAGLLAGGTGGLESSGDTQLLAALRLLGYRSQ